MTACPSPPRRSCALRGLCPRCGNRTLFAGLATFAPKCRACGLDFAGFNVGDGPAAFLIFIVGGLIVGLAIALELGAEPPLWVHILLWLPLPRSLTSACCASPRACCSRSNIGTARARAGSGTANEAAAAHPDDRRRRRGRDDDRARHLAAPARGMEGAAARRICRRRRRMPALDLDPLLDARRPLPPLAFRRALVTCDARDVAAGRPRRPQRAPTCRGQAYLIPCRPGAAGPGRAAPDQCRLGGAARRGAAAVARRHRRRPARRWSRTDGPIMLTAATAAPPLAPSAAAEHREYPQQPPALRLQWFFFAAAAAVIYVLALRKRNAPRLPPEP